MEEPICADVFVHDTYVTVNWPLFALFALTVTICVVIAVLFSRRRKD